MKALRLAALVLAFCATPATAQQAPASQAPAAPAGPSSSLVPKPRQEKIFDLGATWVAVSLDGKPFTGERPSFSVDKQFRARGFAGCNTFAAVAFALRDQKLVVGPILFTKKTCDKAVMAAEQAFLVALRNGGAPSEWDLQGGNLVIKAQTGELRFERAI